LILLTFGLGFWNIGLAVTDYYRYDKITNIERVTPINVTFPAITICNYPDNLDCLRFNGFTNKSIELLTANHSEDFFTIDLYRSFNESISNNQYFNVRIVNKFRVFITNNYLNSFDKLDFFRLDSSTRYDFDLVRNTIELKLPEPYNRCKGSLTSKPYHQSNCIETCIYSEIRNKYNCSFLLSLYSFDGYKQCDNRITFYKNEFSSVCSKECPLESCQSEKYIPTLRVEYRPGNTYLRFAFYDLSVLNITQIPKTDAFTFINNVGGGLGLFMGIAFPNIIEFLQFISEIILIAFNN